MFTSRLSKWVILLLSYVSLVRGRMNESLTDGAVSTCRSSEVTVVDCLQRNPCIQPPLCTGDGTILVPGSCPAVTSQFDNCSAGTIFVHDIICWRQQYGEDCRLVPELDGTWFHAYSKLKQTNYDSSHFLLDADLSCQVQQTSISLVNS